MDALAADDITFVVDGHRVPRDEAMPPIDPDDRVGVVMANGVDGLGAGTFVLASVLEFYEQLGRPSEDDMTYPEYYTIQATDDAADYRMLDIFPAHKNVAVEPDHASILEAIVDRAIDILLVPEGASRALEVTEITRRSAARTIDRCYVYSPDGMPRDADLQIEVPREPVVDWFQATIESMRNPSRSDPATAFADGEGRIRQGVRRTDLESALSLLAGTSAS